MCALKMLRPQSAPTELQSLRFQYEAMLAARLDHPNIVKVFESGEQGGQLWFSMELIEGGRSLETLLVEGSQHSVEVGLKALAEVGRALQYAHEKGIVHRDVKPENILIDAQGGAHITDFGIALDLAQESALTKAGNTVGTPYYMPPEQANGERDRIGPLSDVYALGATMYHLICGRVPFPGENPARVMFEVVTKAVESPNIVALAQRERGLDPDLETICLKAMEKEASDRYLSAKALAEDLEAWIEDRPITARPVGRPERIRKALRRNRKALVGVAVGGGVAALMLLGFGSVVALNFSTTADALRDQDQRAAIEQAATLERAIRLNMLQGRPDVVRALAVELRAAARRVHNTAQIVRTDRTYAYTDFSTRRAVEKRLGDASVRAWAAKEYPELLASIDMLERTGFAQIDASPREGLTRNFPVDDDTWRKVMASAEPTAIKTTGYAGRPVLRVFKPIENGGACQVCHGTLDVASNRFRAVLVIDRDQAGVEAKIRAGRRRTVLVATGTTLALFFLLLGLGRLFGIGLRPRQFGEAERRA